jgi:hypothetical protein
MFKFLNKPYPFSFQPRRRIKQILPIGLCVFAFLVLFKPFGLNSDPHYILSSVYLTCSGGVIGFITTVLIPYLFPSYFNEAKWTLKRNLTWTLVIFFSFTTFMYLSFNIYIVFRYNANNNFTFSNYLWWLYLNLIFGFPLGIIINLVNQYYLLKKHLKIAGNIQYPIQKEEVKPETIKTLEFTYDKFKKVQFGSDKLIYVEALGNYVNIVFDLDGTRKITIREKFTSIEQLIGSNISFYKPHRSYLVNIHYIHKITGDSQGLKIHFRDTDHVVPVSRNKIKEFKGLISSKL